MTTKLDDTVPMDSGRAESADALAETTPLDAAGLADAPRVHSSDDQLVGCRLAHFEVEGVLGSGGMGSVYRARDLSLQRTVALKVLPKDFSEPLLIERFKREARAQARLSHPNVVPIYFIGEDKGRHFFAMELVEGRSLDEELRRRERIGWQEALEQMIDVARALRQAHQRDLIHRDLKPGNLLVTAEGDIKVADFGLAKPIEEGDATLTAEGTFVGTPMYIAPEQARGVTVDHRADMYALGATYFHLLAGQPVFTAPTPMALAIKHVSEPAPRIEKLISNIPRKLVAILDRLLQKSPDDRFDDYDALLSALEDARPKSQPDAGFLVRSIAWSVDLALVLTTAPIHEYAPLVVYPIYVIGAWALGRGTVGQWLFRLRVQNDDDSPLSPIDAVKRFMLMHWGGLVFTLFALVMSYGFGITNIKFKDTELVSPGDPAVQIICAGLLLAIVLVWLLGAMVAAVHPRKRSLHDILAGTKVTYRLDSD